MAAFSADTNVIIFKSYKYMIDSIILTVLIHTLWMFHILYILIHSANLSTQECLYALYVLFCAVFLLFCLFFFWFKLFFMSTTATTYVSCETTPCEYFSSNSPPFLFGRSLPLFSIFALPPVLCSIFATFGCT